MKRFTVIFFDRLTSSFFFFFFFCVENRGLFGLTEYVDVMDCLKQRKTRKKKKQRDTKLKKVIMVKIEFISILLHCHLFTSKLFGEGPSPVPKSEGDS